MKFSHIKMMPISGATSKTVLSKTDTKRKCLQKRPRKFIFESRFNFRSVAVHRPSQEITSFSWEAYIPGSVITL